MDPRGVRGREKGRGRDALSGVKERLGRLGKMVAQFADATPRRAGKKSYRQGVREAIWSPLSCAELVAR